MTPSTPLGIVSMPDLAAALDAAGVPVLGGEIEFKVSAAPIHKAIQAHGPGAVRIVATDIGGSGKTAWLSSHASKGVRVCLLLTGQPTGIGIPEATALRLPTSIDSILAELGLPELGGELGARMVQADGSFDAPVPPIEDFESFISGFDDDEPSAALSEPLIADRPPVAQEPAPAHPPRPAAADDLPQARGEDPAPSHADEDAPDAPALALEAIPDAEALQPAPAWEQAPQPAQVDPEPAAPPVHEPPAAAQPEPPAPLIKADWYPDPEDPSMERLHDGRSWTGARRPVHVPTPIAPPPPPAQGGSDQPVWVAPPPPAGWGQRAQAEPSSRPPALVPPWQQEVAEQPMPSRAYRPQPDAASSSPVLFVFAAKGGAGKTTISLMLAQLAALAGLRSILVDGNRGQGSVRTVMRLGTAGLPTIADVATSGMRPASVILSPAAYQGLRPARQVGELGFGVVLAPPKELASSDIATNVVYGDVIRASREMADLVVVDTQVLDADDASGGAHSDDLLGRMAVPLLKAGAWALFITVPGEGEENAYDRIAQLIRAGVPRERILVVFNRIDPGSRIDKMESDFADRATSMGRIDRDEAFGDRVVSGIYDPTDPAVAAAVSRILLAVTGDEAFRYAPPPPERRNGRRGLFSRGR